MTKVRISLLPHSPLPHLNAWPRPSLTRSGRATQIRSLPLWPTSRYRLETGATSNSRPLQTTREISNMIHVIATIELVEGERDAFLKEFRAVVPKVRAEAGCLEYGPTVDTVSGIAAQAAPRPNVVTVVEKWNDLASLQAHLVAPHMQEYRPRVKHLVRSTTLQVLEPA